MSYRERQHAPMTAEEVAEAKARAKAAHWWTREECTDIRIDKGALSDGSDDWIWAPQGAILPRTMVTLGDTYEGSGEDWLFLAHARQDVPRLIATIEALQALPECALFILLRDDAAVLMEWRTETQRWSFPGGLLEPDETPRQAAHRECLEELGVDANLQRLEIIPTRGFGGHLINAYVATEWNGQPAAREGQRLAWLPLTVPLKDPTPYVYNLASALRPASVWQPPQTGQRSDGLAGVPRTPTREPLSAEVSEHLSRSFKRNEAGLRYLADKPVGDQWLNAD